MWLANSYLRFGGRGNSLLNFESLPCTCLVVLQSEFLFYREMLDAIMRLHIEKNDDPFWALVHKAPFHSTP